MSISTGIEIKITKQWSKQHLKAEQYAIQPVYDRYKPKISPATIIIMEIIGNINDLKDVNERIKVRCESINFKPDY